MSLHLGTNVTGFDGTVLSLDNGARLPADVLVVGTGVVPRTTLASAANMLGADHAFTDVPFFWTHQYDLDLRYTGHGAWDEVRIDGSLPDRDFTARYYRKGELVAAASAGRDRENLEIEAQLHHAS